MDWQGLLKQVAPWIGAAATGNVPALVGMAATTIGNALGKNIKPTADAIGAAIAGATPDQMIALKQADNDFAEKMQQMGFDHIEKLEEIAADDRNSARQREVAVKDSTPRNLAYLIIFGGMGMIGCTLAGWAKADSVLAGTLIGYAVSEMKQVLSYYFGTSASSDKKTDIIASQQSDTQ